MPDISLTPREDQVLHHLRSGATNKEIADTLGVGEQAVKAHVSRLLLKFQVPNRTSLAERAEALARKDRTPAAPRLYDALAEGRELRDRNRVLMETLRRELRSFQRIRRELTERRGGGSDPQAELEPREREVSRPARPPRRPPAP